jgi:hypothetical protein
LIGAGGGGFFLFYVENEKEKLRQAMKDVGLTEVFFIFNIKKKKSSPSRSDQFPSYRSIFSSKFVPFIYL